jgi:hypothetical protein
MHLWPGGNFQMPSKEKPMDKIAAIFDSEADADQAIDRLAELDLDDLDWRIIRPGADHDRLLPGWFGGDSSATGAGAARPIGAPIVADMPEDEALERRGISDEESEFYAQSVANGATLIVLETPDNHVDRVRRILNNAGATRLSGQ